jgi:hypothetical protein
MIVQFFDTDAGTKVYINPEHVVPCDPTPPNRSGSASSSSGTVKSSAFKARMWRWRQAGPYALGASYSLARPSSGHRAWTCTS